MNIKGVIAIREDGNIVDTIDLNNLEGISSQHKDRFFSMGYPYIIIASYYNIVVTTDIGILLVVSRYLQAIGGVLPTMSNF